MLNLKWNLVKTEYAESSIEKDLQNAIREAELAYNETLYRCLSEILARFDLSNTDRTAPFSISSANVIVVNKKKEKWSNVFIYSIIDTMKQCPWFGVSDVLEPIPGCDGLYFTCEPSSIKEINGSRYLIGEAVFIRTDENGIISPILRTDDDALLNKDIRQINQFLRSHGKMIRDEDTDEIKNVIYRLE